MFWRTRTSGYLPCHCSRAAARWRVIVPAFAVELVLLLTCGCLRAGELDQLWNLPPRREFSVAPLHHAGVPSERKTGAVAGTRSGGEVDGRMRTSRSVPGRDAGGIVKDPKPALGMPVLRRSLIWDATFLDVCELLTSGIGSGRSAKSSGLTIYKAQPTVEPLPGDYGLVKMPERQRISRPCCSAGGSRMQWSMSATASLWKRGLIACVSAPLPNTRRKISPGSACAAHQAAARSCRADVTGLPGMPAAGRPAVRLSRMARRAHRGLLGHRPIGPLRL